MCTGSGEASRAGSGPLWIWRLGGFAADPPNRVGLNLSVDHEHLPPTHGYEPTREAAMAAFAKSWRRERKAWTGRLAARFRTIQVYLKDKGALGGHTRSVDRPKPLNDALGSKGERSCTTIRQALGGWQYPASASPKISRLVRMCSIQSIFGIGRSQHVARRTANMMLRLNKLTVSPRAHQRGHGFRRDGELVAVETTHRRIAMCYR
jgi:hypothetical protein